MQRRMAEMAVCGSATVNGYRRRQPYSFCPVNTTWGIDNRTVGLRVIEGSDSAVRVEKRDAGADCNPYLLLAADIAAGLDGIEQGLEPSAMCEGNGYEVDGAEPIPSSLADAIKLARESQWLKEVMSEIQWELYLQMCERELKFYNEHMEQQITSFERERYLENF